MINPVLEALTNARVAEIVDPPRSWKADMKQLFLRLPRDLQLYLAAHEKRREVEIRRCQNDRADAIKKLEVVEAKLAATEDRLERAEAKLKERENVETEIAS
jgi:hypothetical protein